MSQPTLNPSERFPVKGIIVASLIALAILMVVRAPQIFWKGRVYAEEGQYFQLVKTIGLWKSITAGHAGYISGFLLIASQIATWVPMKDVCYVYTSLSMLILALPLVIAARGWRREIGLWFLLVPLIFAFAVPNHETWLNIACSQFVISLAAAMIAIVPIETGILSYAYLLVLLLAGLSGMAPLLLIPLFAFRAWWDRLMRRLVQCLALILCLVAQVICLQYTTTSHRHQPASATFGMAVLAEKQFCDPLFGMNHAPQTMALTDAALSGVHPVTGTLFLWGAPLVIYSGLFLGALAVGDLPAVYAVLAALCLAAGSLLGLIGTVTLSGGLLFDYYRYFYAPNALLMIALLRICKQQWWPFNGWRVTAAFVLAWTLFIGCIEFIRPSPFYFDSDWQHQVQLWQADHSRPIGITPTGWSINIP